MDITIPKDKWQRMREAIAKLGESLTAVNVTAAKAGQQMSAAMEPIRTAIEKLPPLDSEPLGVAEPHPNCVSVTPYLLPHHYESPAIDLGAGSDWSMSVQMHNDSDANALAVPP